MVIFVSINVTRILSVFKRNLHENKTIQYLYEYMLCIQLHSFFSRSKRFVVCLMLVHSLQVRIQAGRSRCAPPLKRERERESTFIKRVQLPIRWKQFQLSLFFLHFSAAIRIFKIKACPVHTTQQTNNVIVSLGITGRPLPYMDPRLV